LGVPLFSGINSAKQAGKKEGGWGECPENLLCKNGVKIFALLRLRIERFRFPLIKRKPKQKIFHILLKEKNGGRKKLKKCNEKISVLVCRSPASVRDKLRGGERKRTDRITTLSERKIRFRATTHAERASVGVLFKKS